MINYQIESNLSPLEFKNLLIKTTLGERRPITDMDRLSAMLSHSNLIITARHQGQLVGISRSVTDFVYCTYLSDLAVDEAYQKQGIGKELIRLTKQKTPKATLILLAAPEAENYYPHIGMSKNDVCFLLKNEKDLV